MHFAKPLLILGLAAPLIAAQADPAANLTEAVSDSSNSTSTSTSGNMTFSNATSTPTMANATALNSTSSNATSPFPPEVVASHATGLTAQNVAWFTVLVGGVCVFAFLF
ncbi:hypothetical protein V1525DRAFT_411745 [Lipomyces kononenkoae]|uniref:Uncharacterized protein n=1 Tax=Lipomyces kononenkoae TaxID=34357 RepID=A0ACC3STB6_LIPKO